MTPPDFEAGNTRVLIVPGWENSGPDHWQTLWQRANPGFRRVEMPDWDRPVAEQWVGALDSVIAESGRPVVLVAHSLGCLTVVRWVVRGGAESVRAGMLVAPPDAERPGCPAEIRGFSPIPRERLPFPSVVVASHDDPWMDQEKVRSLAASWGARFVDAGDGRHLNTESGHGFWPRGERVLTGLLGAVASAPP